MRTCLSVLTIHNHGTLRRTISLFSWHVRVENRTYVRACMYLHMHVFADRRVRHLCMHSYVIHSFFYSVMCSFSSKMSNFSITHAKSHLLLPFYFLLSPFSLSIHRHFICMQYVHTDWSSRERTCSMSLSSAGFNFKGIGGFF